MDATLLTFLRVVYFFYCTKPWRSQEKRLEKLEGSCKANNLLRTFRRSHICTLKTDEMYLHLAYKTGYKRRPSHTSVLKKRLAWENSRLLSFPTPPLVSSWKTSGGVAKSVLRLKKVKPRPSLITFGSQLAVIQNAFYKKGHFCRRAGGLHLSTNKKKPFVIFFTRKRKSLEQNTIAREGII